MLQVASSPSCLGLAMDQGQGVLLLLQILMFLFLLLLLLLLLLLVTPLLLWIMLLSRVNLLRQEARCQTCQTTRASMWPLWRSQWWRWLVTRLSLPSHSSPKDRRKKRTAPGWWCIAGSNLTPPLLGKLNHFFFFILEKFIQNKNQQQNKIFVKLFDVIKKKGVGPVDSRPSTD